MKISELIKKLQDEVEAHGDVNVEVRNAAGDFDFIGFVGCNRDKMLLDVFPPNNEEDEDDLQHG